MQPGSATRTAVVVLALVLLAIPVLAHVPSFPADNTSPDRAVAVPDPAKSWSFYDRLEPGQARYYRLRLAAGQRLRVGTFTPSAGAFTPSVVLMSRSLNDTGDVPPGVTVPEGMGATVIEGQRPDRARYEPFTPSVSYHTVDVDRRVETDRTYLVAVYEPANRSGPTGVTVGYREEFSPVEYATVPFDRVRIRTWEGQHPLVVAGPWLATALGAVALLRTRRRSWARWANPVVRYELLAAAVLVGGSAASTALQTALALAAIGPTPVAVVTVAFVAVPAVCAWWVLQVAVRDGPPTGPWTRAGLATAAVASLATWAGFVAGPVVLLAVAVVPTRFVDPPG